MCIYFSSEQSSLAYPFQCICSNLEDGCAKNYGIDQHE